MRTLIIILSLFSSFKLSYSQFKFKEIDFVLIEIDSTQNINIGQFVRFKTYVLTKKGKMIPITDPNKIKLKGEHVSKIENNFGFKINDSKGRFLDTLHFSYRYIHNSFRKSIDNNFSVQLNHRGPIKIIRIGKNGKSGKNKNSRRNYITKATAGTSGNSGSNIKMNIEYDSIKEIYNVICSIKQNKYYYRTKDKKDNIIINLSGGNGGYGGDGINGENGKDARRLTDGTYTQATKGTNGENGKDGGNGGNGGTAKIYLHNNTKHLKNDILMNFRSKGGLPGMGGTGGERGYGGQQSNGRRLSDGSDGRDGKNGNPGLDVQSPTFIIVDKNFNFD